jgi:phage gp45-like
MKVTRDDIIRVVNQVVQPLYAGAFESVSGIKAKLSNLIPFSSGDNFQVSFPYGFVSKPVKGVRAFIQNLYGSVMSPVVVGQIDDTRPEPDPGVTMLYNEFGQQIWLKNGKILLGSEAATEPAVLGAVFTTQQLALLDIILNHKHVVTAPGALTAALDPATISSISQMKASPLNDKAILSDEIFVQKGGA